MIAATSTSGDRRSKPSRARFTFAGHSTLPLGRECFSPSSPSSVWSELRLCRLRPSTSALGRWMPCGSTVVQIRPGGVNPAPTNEPIRYIPGGVRLSCGFGELCVRLASYWNGFARGVAGKISFDSISDRGFEWRWAVEDDARDLFVGIAKFVIDCRERAELEAGDVGGHRRATGGVRFSIIKIASEQRKSLISQADLRLSGSGPKWRERSTSGIGVAAT